MTAPRRAAAVLCAALAGLSGCATMGERDCVAGDWTHRGELDGAAGLPSSRFSAHRKACARHGVDADEAAYLTGHANGLSVFCAPAGGYEAGREGHGDPSLCDGGETFEQAFRSGRRVHLERNELMRLEQRTHELEAAALQASSAEARAAFRTRLYRAQSRLRSQRWHIEQMDRRYSERFGAEPLEPFELR